MLTAVGAAPGVAMVYFARGAASTTDSAATFGTALGAAALAAAVGASAIVGRCVAGCCDAGAVPGAVAVVAAALSVATTGARFDDGNIIGVMTMTSAMSTSA